jgi:hypothetical protein
MDLYGVVIRDQSHSISTASRKEPEMTTEFNVQFNAQHHQAELLAEAAARRLTRPASVQRDDPAPTGRRLQTLLRRLAGAPTFA